uniref:Uncharacterized protein n=1 Tax=Trichogramma kaykai TaxID=54128 RepID=A0ABD2W4S3_9HYME
MGKNSWLNRFPNWTYTSVHPPHPHSARQHYLFLFLSLFSLHIFSLITGSQSVDRGEKKRKWSNGLESPGE